MDPYTQPSRLSFMSEMRMAFGIGLGRRNAHAVITAIDNGPPGPPGPPRWRWLVNGYVQALGLKIFQLQLPRKATAHFICENDTLPAPGEAHPIRDAVSFGGWIYVREDDGLAWSLNR